MAGRRKIVVQRHMILRIFLFKKVIFNIFLFAYV